MERFVGTCFVLFVVAGVLSVTSGTAVSSTVSNPGCIGNISRQEIQAAINGIKDDLNGLETIKERMTTRVDTLMQSLHTGSMEGSVADTISVFLEYIPGVGTLYKASRTFIHSIQHGDVGLNIIGGAIKDFLYFTNFDDPDVVTVHSVFENENDALRRILNSMGRASNRDRLEAAVKRHLAVVDFRKKGFLLVHHLEANDPFHNRFLSNRVTMAKYALTKGTVYLGLISYSSYTQNSLMTVIVPHGFKEGAPVMTPFKFDRVVDGRTNVISSKTIGTFGVFEIDPSNPAHITIEMLRNEVYYWYTGTVYIGDLEMLENDQKEEYQLIDGYIELTMFSRDPNLPLGHITRLELMQELID